MTESERKRILVDWNQTEIDFPAHLCAHQMFEARVRSAPDAIAVEFRGRKLTYAQLDQRAEVLAGLLRALGVGPDVLVGLCVERSLDLVSSVLGILKAGGAYVPIDPSYPPTRIAHIVADSNLGVVVTERALASHIPSQTARLLFADEAPPMPAAAANHTTICHPGPRNLAYVIYTSGSTGVPKGVQIEHRALVNFLQSMTRMPGLTGNDVVLGLTSLSFDIAGLELLLPLCCGARIVIVPREMTADGRALIDTVKRHHISVMQATPATWSLMLDCGWKGSPSLKVLCGGEALSRSLAHRLLPRCAELWNMYGPTETTIWSTCARITDADHIHIGRPIANTDVYILDAQNEPLPVGGTGELLIGGAGLARGYHNLPALTASRFIAHPFKPGERLYRTGDLALFHDDGTIDCKGRLDFQIKIRGHRIEPREIEDQLVTHERIAQALVTVEEINPGDPQLVAYVVPSREPIPSPHELRRHLESALPEFMRPAAFVSLAKMPLTPNGKLDRAALPRPQATAFVASGQFVEPRNSTEKRLALLFGDLLGIANVSIEDSFFDLGGHSLMAARLTTAIENEFGVRVPLAELLRSPSVIKLSEFIVTHIRDRSRWSSLVPIRMQAGKPNLYLIHGAGGNILLYRELARALDPEISVHGFQSQGLDGKTPPLSTVEDMAARYVRELRVFQTEGPYHLGGYCMGGAVAYEMARLLAREGQTVGVVALLDTYNFNSAKLIKDRTSRLSHIRQKAGFHLANLRQMKLRHAILYLVEKSRMAIEIAGGNHAAFFRRMRNREATQSGSRRSMRYIERINDQAAWDYLPARYDGPVTVFRPQKNYDYYPDLNMGWSEVVGPQLEIVELPINPHAMLIEPFCQHLANEIKRRIERLKSECDHSDPTSSRHHATGGSFPNATACTWLATCLGSAPALDIWPAW